MAKNRFGVESDETDSASDEAVETSSVQGATAAPAAVAAQADGKTWSEWVKELGVNRAIAKGACSEIMADWDDVISRESFESAIKAFGEKGHGR